MNRQQRRALVAENKRRPRHLTPLPVERWPRVPPGLEQVWESRDFLVQLYRDNGALRLSVNSTAPSARDWADGIHWDTLQRIKHDVGYGDWWAVECYPPDEDLVDVGNLRHLWLLPEPPAFGWVKGSRRRKG